MSKNVKDVIFLQSRAAKVDFYTKCDFVLVFYIAAFTCKLNWKYFQGPRSTSWPRSTSGGLEVPGSPEVLLSGPTSALPEVLLSVRLPD